MAANLEQAILEKIQALPDRKQREVLALLDAMLDQKQTEKPSAAVRPIVDVTDDEVLGVWADRKDSPDDIARQLRQRNRQHG